MHLTSLPPEISNKGIEQRNKRTKIETSKDRENRRGKQWPLFGSRTSSCHWLRRPKKASSYPTVRTAESPWLTCRTLKRHWNGQYQGLPEVEERECAKVRAGWKLFGNHMIPRCPPNLCGCTTAPSWFYTAPSWWNRTQTRGWQEHSKVWAPYQMHMNVEYREPLPSRELLDGWHPGCPSPQKDCVLRNLANHEKTSQVMGNRSVPRKWSPDYPWEVEKSHSHTQSVQ